MICLSEHEHARLVNAAAKCGRQRKALRSLQRAYDVMGRVVDLTMSQNRQLREELYRERARSAPW